jgi:hypothetical protein
MVEKYVMVQSRQSIVSNLMASPTNDANQFISQLLRLMNQSPEFIKFLLHGGLLKKIIYLLHQNTSSPQIVMKMLKIVSIWIHPSCKEYWVNHPKDLKCLQVCVGNQLESVSVLVSGLAAKICTKLRRLRDYEVTVTSHPREEKRL